MSFTRVSPTKVVGGHSTRPDFDAAYTHFIMELQTLRERGPRVNIRIPGLLEYLAIFNRAKIYLPDSASQPAATAAFIPPVETRPRKPIWTRLRAFWAR